MKLPHAWNCVGLCVHWLIGIQHQCWLAESYLPYGAITSVLEVGWRRMWAADGISALSAAILTTHDISQTGEILNVLTWLGYLSECNFLELQNACTWQKTLLCHTLDCRKRSCCHTERSFCSTSLDNVCVCVHLGLLLMIIMLILCVISYWSDHPL